MRYTHMGIIPLVFFVLRLLLRLVVDLFSIECNSDIYVQLIILMLLVIKENYRIDIALHYLDARAELGLELVGGKFIRNHFLIKDNYGKYIRNCTRLPRVIIHTTQK